jgi:hypothetical protein
MEGRSAAALTEAPEEVLALLPAGWPLDGGPALDLDETIESGEAPPLSLPNSSVRLTWSRSGFTAMADTWAEWIVEVGRLLTDDGVAVVGLADRRRFERLAGEAWDDSRIGMTVLDAMEESPGATIFHSEWWLGSHWGRAFGRVELLERDGDRRALLSQPVPGITAEELEQPAEGDERELSAAIANAGYLRSQVERLAKRHRHELAALREETDRELMRRSFAEADLEWAHRGAGSPATLAAAAYEGTTSWRVTRPLRALGAMVRRLR